MSIPHPYEDPAIWDTLVLGPHVMPGVWRVTCAAEREIDVKKQKGSDAARLKDQGYKPAELDLSVELVSAADWAALQAAIPDFHPKKKGGVREPVAISHPATQLLGIENVYIKHISAPQVSDGLISLVMRAVQWVPQPAKKKKSENKPKQREGADLLARPPGNLDKL